MIPLIARFHGCQLACGTTQRRAALSLSTGTESPFHYLVFSANFRHISTPSFPGNGQNGSCVGHASKVPDRGLMYERSVVNTVRTLVLLPQLLQLSRHVVRIFSRNFFCPLPLRPNTDLCSPGR
jgi:hypothetical protein